MIKLNPFEKYRSFILEDNFKINTSFNYIDIVNFTKIISLEEKEAIIEKDGKLIKIKGNNMRVARMLEDELLLIGEVKKVILGSD